MKKIIIIETLMETQKKWQGEDQLIVKDNFPLMVNWWWTEHILFRGKT